MDLESALNRSVPDSHSQVDVGLLLRSVGHLNHVYSSLAGRCRRPF
jgi:hypothetical protein